MILKDKDDIWVFEEKPNLQMFNNFGEKRSLFNECLKNSEGIPFFPPIKSDFSVLPYHSQGIKISPISVPFDGKGNHLIFIDDQEEIKPIDKCEEFQMVMKGSNPNRFGSRDISRYIDLPINRWGDYHREPEDYPECRHCENSVPNPESLNGSQIICKIGLRTGSIPSCEPICSSQILKIKRGESKVKSSKHLSKICEIQRKEKKDLEERALKKEQMNNEKSINKINKKLPSKPKMKESAKPEKEYSKTKLPTKPIRRR